MAKLVLAAGVPHPPRIVREIADAPEPLKTETLMTQVRIGVAAHRRDPDSLLGHFVTPVPLKSRCSSVVHQIF